MNCGDQAGEVWVGSLWTEVLKIELVRCNALQLSSLSVANNRSWIGRACRKEDRRVAGADKAKGGWTSGARVER
jgi:hypothetical protein